MSTSRQLLNLPLFVSLSLPDYQPVPITLCLFSYSTLSISVSLCSCFTHNLCNICSYIISLFKSKYIIIALKFHFILKLISFIVFGTKQIARLQMHILPLYNIYLYINIF